MRIRQYLLTGMITLCYATAMSTPPQEVRQPKQKKVEIQGGRPARIQTSACPEQTAVYKSADSKKPAAAKAKQKKAKKVVQKKNINSSSVATDRKRKPVAADKKRSVASSKKKLKKVPEEAGRYIAIKNNLAYQAVAVSNLAVEVQCSDRISVELPLIWSFWDLEQEHGIRTFALQPEARWWTGNEVGRGHFFGIHANVAWFNVKWNDNRYQSNGRPLLGAGISYGYKLPFDAHWGAEFTLGAGYANMKYDTYYNIDNGAKIDTRIRNYWGITRVGLSLVYRF